MFSSLLKNAQRHVPRVQHAQALSSISNSKDKPGRVVFISQSSDAISNLAFEDWLYKHWDFTQRSILFLWRNSPCVVIGRHQNPYTEANLDYLDMAGIPVIRRNSGGGTVYHDDGNINCTFFTSRDRYNRKQNLGTICSALQNDFNLLAAVNQKDDIVLGNGLKVSGTAAKLGRLSAYHHCTLLVSSDKKQLGLCLKGDKTLISKATKSIPSSVTTLQEVIPNLRVESVLSSIGKTFLEQRNDGASHSVENSSYLQSDGFTLINPTEEWFPGLDDIKKQLSSWDWLYGMTPHFKQTRPVTVDESFSVGSSVLVSVEVNRGNVKSLSVDSSVCQSFRDLIENQISKRLVGSRFSSDVFQEIEAQMSLSKRGAAASSSLF